ncbi:dTDP-4-dehydrorhamnose 3,5-epimerase [Hyphomicrobium sp.]|uniref:dTDP-4-dehydrorhamnose 3,5-epimerase n=1 Tax=Hyphomicrobium sp. TaxID=82 RepID=UPI003F72ED08
MIFEATPLAGAFVLDPAPIADSRGFFARLFCAATFTARGLNPHFDQISMSQNVRAGTIRGFHLQRPPAAECKLIRVTAGAIYDVIVDVRAGSATYGQWFGVELSAANRRLIYVPEGFAHGFQTLAPETEVTYHITHPLSPEHATGLPFDDPDLAVAWPIQASIVISDRDRAWPPFREFGPVEIPPVEIAHG